MSESISFDKAKHILFLTSHDEWNITSEEREAVEVLLKLLQTTTLERDAAIHCLCLNMQSVVRTATVIADNMTDFSQMTKDPETIREKISRLVREEIQRQMNVEYQVSKTFD